MLNAKIGDIFSRIVAPTNGHEGYMQTGLVIEISETVITLAVQADIVRRMSFRRCDGKDTEDLGSFIVRTDSVEQAQVWSHSPRWLPIASVPKDERPVLVCLTSEYHGSRIHTASFHPNMGIIGGFFAFDVPQATHWMVQPALPSAVKNGN